MVYVQKKETLFLVGKQVDFYEGADARGFVFVNPANGIGDKSP